jgi:Uma2 family endonuclease
MVAQVNKPAEVAIDPSIVAPTRYSIEEYLALEVDATERHEYRDGAIVLMSGGLPNHNRISRNLCTAMTVGLRGQPFEVFVADQRLWMPLTRLYTYPDVMVIAGELVLQPGRKDTVTNPVLIVEVLSKSTQAYDRGEKFTAYRSIPSFAEYVLVDQYSQHIEHYVKTSAKKWDFQEYDETDTVVRLGTIGLDITIADIYDKVEFEVLDPIS